MATKFAFHKKASNEHRTAQPQIAKKAQPTNKVHLKYKMPYRPFGARYERKKKVLASWKYPWFTGAQCVQYVTPNTEDISDTLIVLLGHSSKTSPVPVAGSRV